MFSARKKERRRVVTSELISPSMANMEKDVSTLVESAETTSLPREIVNIMDSIKVNWDYMSSEQVRGHGQGGSSIVLMYMIFPVQSSPSFSRHDGREIKRVKPVSCHVSEIGERYGHYREWWCSSSFFLFEIFTKMIDYHQAFNDAIHSFSTVVENIAGQFI
jgi:hypothetical protein